MKNSKPDGVHYLISFFGCDKKQINSLKFWKKTLPAAIACSKMTVLHDYYYEFSPCGITGFLLLSASHLSLHTWPENNYAACDVFSCSNSKDTEKVVEYLKKHISHERIEIKKERRGFTYCQA